MAYTQSKVLNNGVEIPVLGLGVFNSGEGDFNSCKNCNRIRLPSY